MRKKTINTSFKKDYISEKDLPSELNKHGLDIPPTFYRQIAYYIDVIKDSRKGEMTDNGIEKIAFYNKVQLENYILVLKDLVTQLKEKGCNITLNDAIWCKLFISNKTYLFNVDEALIFYNSINPSNIVQALKEIGIEIELHQINHIKDNCREDHALCNKGYPIINVDKVKAYLNEISDCNLKQKLQEWGYSFDDKTIQYIQNYKRYLIEYKNGAIVYKVEYLKQFIEANLLNFRRMDNEDMLAKTDSGNYQNEFFGSDLSHFFDGVSNFYSSFPISKWYVEKHNTIPDVLYIGRIYIQILFQNPKYKLKWVKKNITDLEGEDEIEDIDVLRIFYEEDKREYIIEGLLELEEGMYILLCDGTFNRKDNKNTATSILFYKEGIHDPTSFIESIADEFVTHDDTGTLSLLYHNQNGFNSQDFTIPNPEIDFNYHYNEGFEEIHNIIYSALSREKGKGLVLLHGKPGTGKTTYIRYLINQINKNKIFVPPNLTELLSDPGFIPFLMNNSNCILFVEDAENVLRSREDGQNNQAVSNILNITDGLLSDCLNIQIVATFNTDLKNIDSALLRKGRLIAQYEFNELTPERAEKLADSLKVWLHENENLTVADIYAAKGKPF